MAHTKTFVAFVDNDLVVELLNLTDSTTGVVDSGATVTIETITNKAGTEITGPTFPVSMAAIGGTPGGYRALVPETASFKAGYTYTVDIKAVSGASNGRWKPTVDAKIRRNI